MHPTTSLSCRDNAGRSSIAMRIASEYFNHEHDRVLPIATTIANEQVSCDESRMTHLAIAMRIAGEYADRNNSSIAMMIANEYHDRKHERVRSIATVLVIELAYCDEGRMMTICRSR